MSESEAYVELEPHKPDSQVENASQIPELMSTNVAPARCWSWADAFAATAPERVQQHTPALPITDCNPISPAQLPSKRPSAAPVEKQKHSMGLLHALIHNLYRNGFVASPDRRVMLHTNSATCFQR